MEKLNLIESFSELKEEKNIDRPTMMKVIEEVFRSTLVKTYGTDENYDIIINDHRCDFEIWRRRQVVKDGEVVDSNLQISLSDAKKIEDDYEVGEEVTEAVPFTEFSRRDILSLGQNLRNRILELEKDHVYAKYKDRVGTIVSAEVYQTFKREVLLRDDEGKDLVLPKADQIPGDFFKKGDNVRAVVDRVDMNNSTPTIYLSRTSPKFLECLFEQEIPEIKDGLITIKNIKRIPGERAKVAVETYDDRVDPVGACVGMKGARIHGIVRELRNENIDVINYTNNAEVFITRALSPARVSKIDLDKENKHANVTLQADQVSLAIGKGGNNIRLASMLTGYEIDVYRDNGNDNSEMNDVDLEEFADEIDGWVIDAIKAIGCDTALSVLEIPIPDLVRRTDLEEETIKEVVKILKEELED
ncbi:MAG: transcription termination factor NusA [Salinivirgaceae bacterium]|nr:transcription termination factor NusA [Salinivirgaceae bacterium]